DADGQQGGREKPLGGSKSHNGQTVVCPSQALGSIGRSERELSAAYALLRARTSVQGSQTRNSVAEIAHLRSMPAWPWRFTRLRLAGRMTCDECYAACCAAQAFCDAARDCG